MKTNILHKIKMGEVGVDSGQLLICDPCYLKSNDNIETSKRLIDSGIWNEKDGDHKQIRNKKFTVDGRQYGGAEIGVKFDSGYGDGCYSVYGFVNEDNRIVKVEIIMEDY